MRFDLDRGARVLLAADCAIGARTRLIARAGTLQIGTGCVLGERCILSALTGIELGPHAILADEVAVFDHEYCASDPEQPIRLQGLLLGSVRIGADARVGPRAVVRRGAQVADGGQVGAQEVRELGPPYPRRNTMLHRFIG